MGNLRYLDGSCFSDGGGSCEPDSYAEDARAVIKDAGGRRLLVSPAFLGVDIR